MGNDPTLSTMSRWRFPIKLQSNIFSTAREGRTHLVNRMRVDPFPLSRGIFFEHQEGFEPPLIRFAGVCLKPLDHWCLYFRADGGNRTHISTLQRWCNDRYTTSAFLVQKVGLEPTRYLFKHQLLRLGCLTKIPPLLRFSSWCGLRSHYLRRIRSALYQLS